MWSMIASSPQEGRVKWSNQSFGCDGRWPTLARNALPIEKESKRSYNLIGNNLLLLHESGRLQKKDPGLLLLLLSEVNVEGEIRARSYKLNHPDSPTAIRGGV